MISREPTLERLATARQLLLEPFGLDDTHLARALAEIRAHQVDDADLYFQYTRSEGWSLEEGIVKTGSFSIDQGVGVRAVSGEKTAFAYSDDISAEALNEAAHAARAIARQGSGRVKVPSAVAPRTPARHWISSDCGDRPRTRQAASSMRRPVCSSGVVSRRPGSIVAPTTTLSPMGAT